MRICEWQKILEPKHYDKRQIWQDKFKKLVLDYDMGFYKMKNGRINISKMSRCTGFSRSFLSRELGRKGLL